MRSILDMDIFIIDRVLQSQCDFSRDASDKCDGGATRCRFLCSNTQIGPRCYGPFSSARNFGVVMVSDLGEFAKISAFAPSDFVGRFSPKLITMEL